MKSLLLLIGFVVFTLRIENVGAQCSCEMKHSKILCYKDGDACMRQTCGFCEPSEAHASDQCDRGGEHYDGSYYSVPVDSSGCESSEKCEKAAPVIVNP